MDLPQQNESEKLIYDILTKEYKREKEKKNAETLRVYNIDKSLYQTSSD